MAGQSDYWTMMSRKRINRRHLLAGGAAGVSGLALAAGCGGGTASQQSAKSTSSSSAPETPQPGGTANTMQVGSPTTFDFHRTTSFYTLMPAGAVMSRLMRFKTGVDPKTAEDHDVESDLAVSLESPDAVTWTVKLRPDAKFQNVPPVSGHAVEAEDIKASFTRALGKENPASGSLSMIDPAQIETPDKNTVVFKLKFPYAPFNKTLASPNYSFIYPREAVSGAYDPAKTLIGSGPFILDSFQSDVALNYKRNPDYYEKGRPYIDGIHHAIIPDAAQRLAQFTSSNVDTIGEFGTSVSPNDIETLKKSNPKATLLQNSPQTGGPDCLFFQLGDSSSPFQDVRLRRAISMALDRDALAKTMWNGFSEPGCFFVGHDFGKWGLRQNELPSETAQYYKFDPAGAKKLLAEAGMADKQLKLIYVTGYLTPPYDTAAQTIASMLNSSGIKTALVTVDYQKDYIGGGKGIRYGNYPSDNIVFAGISTFTEADEFIFNYYHSTGTSGLSRLKDPALDSMIDKARSLLNEADRVKAYKDIQKYLADKMYTVMGFANAYQHLMVQPRLQNHQRTFSYGFFAETYSKVWLKR